MATDTGSYASASDLESRWRPLDPSETARAEALLRDASTVVDAELACAGRPLPDADLLRVVVCQMVERAMGVESDLVGAGQGSTSLGDYTRTVTFSGSTAGDLYLTRGERRLLGLSRARVSSVRVRRPSPAEQGGG